MAQQNKPLHSSLRGELNPRNLSDPTFEEWQKTLPTAQEMVRDWSNDSGYRSIHSAIPPYPDYPSPQYSPAAMSYSSTSPGVHTEENYSTYRYPPDVSFVPPSQVLGSTRSNIPRSTISSMGLIDDSRLKDNYKFVVPRSKEPYFELQPSVNPHVAAGYPLRIYLDPPSNLQRNEFPCQYPTCASGDQGKFFRRPADLERHYRNVHGPAELKDKFLCDYEPCQKNRLPFNRKDHFRDHLRDYHKEDLGAAKGEKTLEKKTWTKLQDAWIAERKLEARWWRCPKCLTRISIAKSGWDCLECKNPCDAERRERIENCQARTASIGGSVVSEMEVDTAPMSTPVAFPGNCVPCDGTAYLWNPIVSDYDLCHYCQQSGEQLFKFDEEWGPGAGSSSWP